MTAHESTVPPAQATASLPRRWLWAHLLSLALVLGLLLLAARGQYFYYDEWDFLAARAEWNLLAPHVGHLSFFPQLLTTITKGLFGLHTYWPYLLPTIAVHLVVIHLLWRLMMRAGVQPLLALLGAVLFGVLAPGADNTLWAFQIGFIAPFAFGLGAILLASRSRFERRHLIWLTMMLVLAAGFSGTALPMAGAVVVLLYFRQGWRIAVVPAIAFAFVYGTWYLLFNTAPTDWDALRADSPWEILIGVPQFIAHGFVDSVGGFLPLAALSPVLLVLLAVWLFMDLRRSGARAAGIQHYLILALLAFATLTALSRVGLGNNAASAGRYAYVYGLLLAVAAALAATALVRRSTAAIAISAALVAVLAGYNAGGLMVAAQEQSAQELTVPRAMSAALSIVDCDDNELQSRIPARVVAPTLTMADICSFVERGQFTPIEFTSADLLDARLNLFLEASSVDSDVPSADRCLPRDSGDAVPYDPATQLIYIPGQTIVRVHASENGAFTQYVSVELPPGVSRLVGEGIDDVAMRLGADGTRDLCIFDADE